MKLQRVYLLWKERLYEHCKAEWVTKPVPGALFGCIHLTPSPPGKTSCSICYPSNLYQCPPLVSLFSHFAISISSVSVLSLRLWRSVDSEELWNYGTRSISCWRQTNKVLSTLTGLSMKNLLLCCFVRNAQHLLASTAVLQLLLPLKAHWKRWGSFVTGPFSVLYVQTALKLWFFRK